MEKFGKVGRRKPADLFLLEKDAFSCGGHHWSSQRLGATYSLNEIAARCFGILV